MLRTHLVVLCSLLLCCARAVFMKFFYVWGTTACQKEEKKGEKSRIFLAVFAAPTIPFLPLYYILAQYDEFPFK